MYPRMVVSSERISEVMAMPISIDPNDDGVTETATKGYLEFDKVTFAYPGETESPVLKDISFKAKPGETIAFIGSTGSGKSSLVNLIPRFYDVTLGKILVDGVDVRDYQLKALRQKIGFIPQKALLFTGTIEENLKYGKSDATSEELQAAADIAQAKEFIESRDDRYQTHLAEGGSNLSGGQKQRLSIARAVVKKPDIYIFDDSFSALDYKTDAQLRARLKEVTQEATVLIVAQRVGTIMDADQIIVLDKGEIVGRGTHDELMQSNDIYREIANSQLNKAEEIERRIRMSKRNVFLRLWDYLRQYKGALFLAVFLKIFSSVMSVLEPFVLGLAITELTSNLMDMAHGVAGAHLNISLYCYYFGALLCPWYGLWSK